MINLSIEGPGPDKLTISGGGNFTILQFQTAFPPTFPFPPGFTPNSLSITGLTLADGNANGGFGDGGAIDNTGALSLTNDVFSNNAAPAGIGGAIYSGGFDDSMNISNVLFSGNSVGQASDTFQFELGGAIFNTDGVANISASTFINNQAIGANAQGGAIQTSYGSTLNVTGCSFINNQAVGSQYGSGGAIFGDPAQINVASSKFINNLAEGDSQFQTTSGGAISMNAQNFENLEMPVTENITNSVFSGNKAIAEPGSGGTVQGGAVASDQGTLDLSGSTFLGNVAAAGSITTSFGGIASGGALYTVAESLEATSDTFQNNQALGGSSPVGVFFATGGAVEMFLANPTAPNPVSTISNSLFTGNLVAAGSGGGTFTLTGGGAIADLASPSVVNNTSFLGNQAIGSQGASGVAGTEADGGAIWLQGAVLTIQGGLIAGNTAQGGAGGDSPGGTGGAGGNGGGGGVASLAAASLTVSGTTFAGNSALGGSGGTGSTRGAGGSGFGGAIEVDPPSALTLTNSIVIGNLALGASGGGDGFGGGVYTLGTTTITDTLVTLNDASGGSGGGQGIGGGLYIAGGTTTLTGKTKVVFNFASTSSDDIYGPYAT